MILLHKERKIETHFRFPFKWYVNDFKDVLTYDDEIFLCQVRRNYYRTSASSR
jgi:hypothetical protein